MFAGRVRSPEQHWGLPGLGGRGAEHEHRAVVQRHQGGRGHSRRRACATEENCQQIQLARSCVI